MRYVILLVVVSVFFAGGYVLGKAGVRRCPPQEPIVQKPAGSEEMIKRHSRFQEIMGDSFNRANDVQAKINAMRDMSEYLRKQTEDAAKAGSLEGSMVLEARYRESLNALLGLKDELNTLLAAALQNSVGYVSVLTQEIPSLSPSAK